jgi:signal transduction histidine kinase
MEYMTDKNTLPRELSKEEVADALVANFDEIFEIYERKLVEEQNLLAASEANTRDRLRDQAVVLVTRAAGTLRGSESEMSALEEEIQQNSDAARAPFIQQPDESFRAGVALCEAAMEVVLDRVDLSKESPEDVAELSLTVQKGVMDHVARVAMASYVDYLLAKIGEIQTEERHRFSRDLHDNVAHSMALVKQNIELYSALRDKDEAAAEAKLESALETSERAIQSARDMAMELRTSDTGDTLRVALDNLVRASVPPGVEVEIEVTGEEDGVPDSIRDQIYMTMREGLRNAVSHSGGTRVRMEVSILAAEVVAAVEDWGGGFDTSSGAEGVGLRSMRERAALMRGSFNVVSAPVRVPLSKRRR